MNKSEHFPSVRLAVAGYMSLALLAWIGFMPGCFPPISLLVGQRVYPLAGVVTGSISFAILVILAPVVWNGPQRDRWLGLLLAVFPFLAFGVIAWWLGAWAIHG